MTTDSVARRMAQFACSLEDFPEEVWHAADRALLDTVAAIIAGGVHPQTRAIAKSNSQSHATGSATLSTGGVADVSTAALVNGMAAHVWDIDDTSYTGIMHGSAVITPALLAIGQEVCADYKTLLRAFVAGSEVTYTLADVCTHQHYFRGWWSTTTFGLLGATVSVGILLELSEDAMTCAIGMAAAAAGGSKSVFGTDSKPFLVGDAASRAIAFARAAQAGLTGPEDVFEDDRGYFKLLNNGIADTDAMDSLGMRWRLVNPGLMIKSSPVCSAAHAAIDQMALLMSELGATANDILDISAEVPELVYCSLKFNDPQTPQQAQFSLPYALACSALHGKVRFDDLLLEEINTPKKRELIEKVSTESVADLSTQAMRSQYPESARLKITLNDGRVASGFCGSARGMPDNPLDDQELLSKFESVVSFAGRNSNVLPRLGENPIDIFARAMS